MLTPREKSPTPEKKKSSEEYQKHNTASSMTASLTLYQAIPAPFFAFKLWLNFWCEQIDRLFQHGICFVITDVFALVFCF